MLRSPFFYLFTFLLLFSCKEKTLTKINKSKLTQKEAINFRDKGIVNFEKKNLNVAFLNFNKAKIISETIRDSANIAYNLIRMASIQQITGDYYGSKETLTEALPYIKRGNIFSVSVNNFFGIADKELSLYNDAVYYYKEAIKDCTDSISKQSPLNNIAAVYIKQEKYEKAITILESILNRKFLDASAHTTSKSRVQDNLGYAYFKKGKNDKGLLLMTESLKTRSLHNDSYGSIESYLHLAEYYAKTDSKKSNQYALGAYKSATKLNSIDERLRALQFLILNDFGRKNIEYAKKYITLNDSIIKIRNNYKNKFAKIKYDSKKEKDENQKLRLEKAENLVALKEAEKEKIILYASIIITLIALVFLRIYLRKRYNHKTRLVEIKTAYDTETRIAKNIHDELANDVFHTITYTQTQPLTTENSKETLLQKLNHIYSRVRGISRENSNVDTGSNYSASLKEMLSTYNSNSTNVIITNIEKVSWDNIEHEKKVTIYRVLQELMVNMKKHSEALLVVIKFDSKSNAVIIEYTDNGKGCEKSKIIKNGLQNMENRILATKGTITFDTQPNKGFKAKITLPK